MSENADVQSAFNEIAKARLADPMVTDEPRTSSTLDVLPVETMEKEWSDPALMDVDFTNIEFDEAPGSFEDDVLARLENLENAIEAVIEGNTKTHDAMTKVVEMVEKVSEQVEPTLKAITESKWFRMFIPQGKGN
jgi:hypothetical protein